MVPAFPMDGGRVLRSLLGMFVDYGRATRWAAAVGQGIAMLVVLSMLVSGAFQPFLMLIAVFIFIAAGQEAAVVTQEEATKDLLVRDAMVTQFVSLRPTDLLRDAVTLLLAGSQHDFPVLDERGSVIGILSRKRLVSALAEFGPGHPAQLVLEPCAEGVGPLQPLSSAIEFLNASACPAVPVIDPVSGRLVGLLTSENIGEMLMIRAALAPRVAAAARSDSL
jgi:stage IV sporulation protein FB